MFTGPNEAGKSTLLAYIRGVLFGFPDKRRHLPLYAPVHGGRHGGRLFVLADDERYVIEREAGTTKKTVVVTLPDGGVGSEDDLAHLLGNADSTLFETVFAFTLHELQELASLTKSEAAQRIFSAGLVGAGQSRQKVVADLGGLASDIYKRQGRGGALRDALAEITQTESLLVQAREAAAGYPRLAEQLGAAERDMQEVDGQASVVRDQIARLRSLQKLWPVWSELLEAEAELQGAGDEQIDEETLAGLVADLTLHRERLGRLPSLAAKALQAAADLEARLADLGPDWTTQRLDALDVSLPTRDLVRDWERRLRETDALATEAQRRLEQAQDARGTLLRERERLPVQADARATGGTTGAPAAARWVLAAAAGAGVVVSAALLATGSAVAGVVALAAALLLAAVAAVIGTALHADQRVARAEQQRAGAHLAGVNARLQDGEQACSDQTAALHTAQEAAARLDGEWTAWKSEKGVPAALSPEGVIDFFAVVEQARSLQRALTTTTAEQDETERLIADWEKSARDVAAPNTELAGERLAARVEHLAGAQRQRRESQARVAGLQRTLASGAREGERVDDLRAVLAAGEPATWTAEDERLYERAGQSQPCPHRRRGGATRRADRPCRARAVGRRRRAGRAS